MPTEAHSPALPVATLTHRALTAAPGQAQLPATATAAFPVLVALEDEPVRRGDDRQRGLRRRAVRRAEANERDGRGLQRQAQRAVLARDRFAPGVREIAAVVDRPDLRRHAAGPGEPFPLQHDLRSRVAEVADEEGSLPPVGAQAGGERELARDGPAGLDAPRGLDEPAERAEGLVRLQRHAVLGEDPEPAQFAVEEIADVDRSILELQQRRGDERRPGRARPSRRRTAGGRPAWPTCRSAPSVPGQVVPLVQVVLGLGEALVVQQPPDLAGPARPARPGPPCSSARRRSSSGTLSFRHMARNRGRTPSAGTLRRRSRRWPPARARRPSAPGTAS